VNHPPILLGTSSFTASPQDPAFITTVRGTGYMFQFLD
jgi:hypothetical protein